MSQYGLGEIAGKRFCFYKDAGGRWHRRVCRGCSGRKEEEEEYASGLRVPDRSEYLVRNIAADMYLPGSEHLNRLAVLGRNLTDNTRQQRRIFIERIVKTFGDRYIDELSISVVFMELMRDTTHSASWKNNYLETFSAIYDETVWKCAVPVPRPKFRRFLRNPRKADVLSTEELERLFRVENWRERRDYVVFLVMASCGLRLGEARALRLGQFHFEQRILVVDGFCRVNGERTGFNKAGSIGNAKVRVAPMSRELVAAVERYVAVAGIRNADEFVFRRTDGKVLRQEYLERVFKAACVSAGIDSAGRKLVPHSLRYTYVTRMRRFLPVDVVRRIAGHTSERMTDYYTRFGISEMVDGLAGAMEAADKLFE